MTKVKICGIKTVETLQLLARRNADYVGFVFAKSKRQVTAEHVARLLQTVEQPPRTVGVFVNPTMEELASVMQTVPLHVIQLHGQESPDFCRRVKERLGTEVWKAIAVGEEGPEATDIESYLPFVNGCLFDTYHAKLAGGTGQKFEWSEIPRIQQRTAGTLHIIAGGIDPDNVGDLLRRYRPEAIDISSGVETDGVKDDAKIIQLIEKVRAYDTNR